MNRKLHDATAERPDEDNPEWTASMMRQARLASEVLPGLIGERAMTDLIKRGRGRPVTGTARKPETFRLPPDVTQAYKAAGDDWRDLVVQTLRDHAPGK